MKNDPQRAKVAQVSTYCGSAEAVPFQNGPHLTPFPKMF